MADRRKRPQRSCIGCRQVKDQDDLIRLVRAPDGEVLVDLKGRLPGRGAYLCNSRDCIGLAVSRQQFSRAFRSECRPADAAALADRVARNCSTKWNSAAFSDVRKEAWSLCPKASWRMHSLLFGTAIRIFQGKVDGKNSCL